MAKKKFDCVFEKSVRTLGQVLSRTEFPFVVKTRNQLVSFDSEPLQPQGAELCIEGNIDIDYAHVRVLPSHNEKERVSVCLMGLSIFENDFDEFYIPVNYEGGLKIQSYRSKKQIFASVDEIMDQRPRYLRSHVNIMAVSTKRSGKARLKCIKRDTVVKVVDIEQSSSSKRVLKCTKTSGRAFFLKENAQVNFTAVADEQVYTLTELRESGPLLPVPIKFVSGTISPECVSHFSPITSNHVSKLAELKLELLQFVSVKNVVGRMFDTTRSCLKSLLLPSTFYDNFHVQLAEFKDPEERDDFIARHFGGAIYGNDVIDGKLFFVPVDGNLVTWLKCSHVLQAESSNRETTDDESVYERPPDVENVINVTNNTPKQVYERPPYVKTTDDESFYERPPDVENVINVKNNTPKQESNFYARMRLQPLNTGVNTEFMHTVELLPSVKIRDQNVFQKILEKTKMGFGHVHKELMAFFYGKIDGSLDRMVPQSPHSSEDTDSNVDDAYGHLVVRNAVSKHESLVTVDKEGKAGMEPVNLVELPSPTSCRSLLCALSPNTTNTSEQTAHEYTFSPPLSPRVYSQDNLTQEPENLSLMKCRVLSQDNLTHDPDYVPPLPHRVLSHDNLTQEADYVPPLPRRVLSQNNLTHDPEYVPPLPRRVLSQDNLTQEPEYLLPLPSRVPSQDNLTHGIENKNVPSPRSPSFKDNIEQKHLQEPHEKCLSSLDNRRGALPSISPPANTMKHTLPVPLKKAKQIVPPSPYITKQTIPTPPTIIKQALPLPPNVTKQTVPPLQNVKKQTVPPPPNITKQTLPPPPVITKQTVPPPPNITKQTLPPPPVITKQTVPPPSTITKQALPLPPDITKQTVPHPHYKTNHLQQQTNFATLMTYLDKTESPRSSSENEYMAINTDASSLEICIDHNYSDIEPRTNNEVAGTTKPSDDIHNDNFESFTIAETAACFRKCGLDDLAVICEEHFLDGYFMKYLNLDILTDEPFYMNKLQIDKFRLILAGWRPKH